VAERRSGDAKSAALRIKLKYPDVDVFLQRYGPNLSKTAVFIATKTLKPVGTNIRFEFVLVNEAGEQPVFRGEGTVDSLREGDAVGPGKPHGMSVKFSRLFGDGEQLIARALKLRSGQRGTVPAAPPKATRDQSGEVELTSPRDISSGEFEGLAPPDQTRVELPLEPTRVQSDHSVPTRVEAPPEDDELMPQELLKSEPALQTLKEDDEEPPPPPPRARSMTRPPPPPPEAVRPLAPQMPPPLAEPSARIELISMPRASSPPGEHVDVDALAAEWQIATDRVDEILRRRRPRDPAYAAELDALLSRPTPDAVSAAEATSRLAQLLDRRRRPR
jgi:hypothetical protein